MIRTVDDLLEELKNLVDAHPAAGKLPLRVAYQPNYPLHVSLVGARVTVQDGADGRDDVMVLTMVAGTCPYGENPYASSELWQGEGQSLVDDYEAAELDPGEAGEACAQAACDDYGVPMSQVAITDTQVEGLRAYVTLEVNGAEKMYRWTSEDGPIEID